MKVEISGPVLLLMGPLGSFFSRFADFLLENGVSTHKVMFPLREHFPGKKRITLHYARPMSEWRAYLKEVLARHGIKHLFMYGDFIAPHRMAIDLANELGLEAWVFELGYIRPHYVTLERDRVNARSNLNKPVEFYHALPEAGEPAKPALRIANRWRRVFKPPCFIQHAFTDYQIIEGPHKLQPKPSYLWYQLLGWARQPLYVLTERRTRNLIRSVPSLFLVALQVSIDSQVTLSSPYGRMEAFITDVLESFARHSAASQHLVFKHHPRDRGYNNYGAFIAREADRLEVGDRTHYIHDDKLVELFKHCAGVITINSTVGLTSLRYSVPTKVLGKTFYDLPGLTSQGPLDGFWTAPEPVDRALFVKFHNYMVEQTQINGNFDGYFPFDETFRFERTCG